jgi:hypothetical protein
MIAAMVRLPAPARPLFPYLKPAYTLATRAVAPLSIRISRRRGTPLPAGAAMTMEAAAGPGDRVLTVRPAEVVRRNLPEPSPTPHPIFEQNLLEEIPRVAIAELTDGAVLSPHAAVVNRRGELMQEQVAYFGTTRPREHPLYWNPFRPPPTRIGGRLGVLSSRGDGNYYHFLMDVIPRLAIVEQSAVAPPERWYVPTRQPFQRELLLRAGVPEATWLDPAASPDVVADTLVVPGLPSTVVRNPPWVVGFLRDRLLGQPPALSHPGVYVTRGPGRNNRSVRNEHDVVAMAVGHGLTPIDPARMTVAEQIEAFSTARLIVAPHGAALANLVFAGSGAAVIELFPAGYARPDYWKLANGVPGLGYHYLLGVGRPVRSLSQFLVTDITVDLAVLSGMIEQLQRSG